MSMELLESAKHEQTRRRKEATRCMEDILTLTRRHRRDDDVIVGLRTKATEWLRELR